MTKSIEECHALFVGKTIKSMDTVAVNSITFYFTDGTSVEVETERYVADIYGFVTHVNDTQVSGN